MNRLLRTQSLMFRKRNNKFAQMGKLITSKILYTMWRKSFMIITFFNMIYNMIGFLLVSEDKTNVKKHCPFWLQWAQLLKTRTTRAPLALPNRLRRFGKQSQEVAEKSSGKYTYLLKARRSINVLQGYPLFCVDLPTAAIIGTVHCSLLSCGPYIRNVVI